MSVIKQESVITGLGLETNSATPCSKKNLGKGCSLSVKS